MGFKPYYKWIIFNMEKLLARLKGLAICFKPYYKWIIFNIVVQGIEHPTKNEDGFKPYYKWIIFNI